MKLNAFFSKRPEQFTFVNRFGPRFLKNRIRMMNQSAKYRRSWPVYVFLLAVMSLVTTMAAVEKHKKKPVALTRKKAVVKPVMIHPLVRKKTVLAVDPKMAEKSTEPPTQNSVPALDSVLVLAEKPVVETEKRSRYTVEKDGLIYWIITPKMSFNDLSELKQTIEKTTLYTFDFTQIKFDPLQVYIDAIGVNVHKEKGGSGSTSGGDDTDEPIKSIGGYVTTKPQGSLGIGEVRGQDSFGMPPALIQLAREDEKAISGLVEEKRIEYFIQKNQKYGFGSSRTVMGKWLLENPGRRNEDLGVFVNDENRVQLYQPETVTVFIDGKEVKAEEVSYLNPKQLHTVIVKDMRKDTTVPDRKNRYVQLFLHSW